MYMHPVLLVRCPCPFVCSRLRSMQAGNFLHGLPGETLKAIKWTGDEGGGDAGPLNLLPAPHGIVEGEDEQGGGRARGGGSVGSRSRVPREQGRVALTIGTSREVSRVYFVPCDPWVGLHT